MTTPKTTRRKTGLPWAIVGAVILLVGIGALVTIAIINATTTDASPTAEPTDAASSNTPTEGPSIAPSPAPAYVDQSVTERGWVPEPITGDEDLYIRAALTAAATFDTTLADRNQWLTHLDTWFTPDTRYTSDEDRAAQLEQARLELRQSVVLPEDTWNSLATEEGRVVAEVTGDVAYSPVPENPAGDMFIGEADVTLTFTSTTEGDQEASYEQAARVRVQVLCGGDSVPTPSSAQQSGDCKVVRYFGADGS
jgi:hypothetical protein